LPAIAVASAARVAAAGGCSGANRRVGLGSNLATAVANGEEATGSLYLVEHEGLKRQILDHLGKRPIPPPRRGEREGFQPGELA